MRARSSGRAASAAAALILVLAAACPHASAGDGDPEDAAWEACSAAYERVQVERKEGHLLAAKRSLTACLEPACPAPARRDCTEWLREVDASLPTVVLDAKDEAGRQLTSVHVSVDGNSFAERLDGVGQPIDPGKHRFRFEAPGRAAIEQEVNVLEGERNRRIAVDWRPARSGAAPLADRPGRRPSVVGPLVLGGFGLLALGSFAYFGATSIDREDELETTCAKTRTCTQPELDSVYNRRIAADISLGVGALAIGVATVWLVVELSGGQAERRTALIRF